MEAGAGGSHVSVGQEVVLLGCGAPLRLFFFCAHTAGKQPGGDLFGWLFFLLHNSGDLERLLRHLVMQTRPQKTRTLSVLPPPSI